MTDRPETTSFQGASALALCVAVTLGGCSGEPPNGALRGQLIESIARFDDGTSATRYYLRVDGDERQERELILATEPDLLPMTEVTVTGAVRRDGAIVVDRLEPVSQSDEGDGPRAFPLVGAPPIPATKMVMVVVDIGKGVNTTTEELDKRLFKNPDSIKAYYLENSFGMHDLVGMVMPTPYSYSMTSCDTRGMTAALRSKVDADAGQTFDIYLWYIGQKTSLCGWSGLSSGRDTFYNGSSSCVVLVQEPGHSFGLSHSSRLSCSSGGSVVPLSDDVTTCKHSEYGNPYDTMGGGCRHFSAYHKVFRTYLQKCNGVKVRSTGTFTLHPIENPCDGVQVLQVPMPKVRTFTSSGGGGGTRTTGLAYYLVELRAAHGFDKLRTPMAPSVLVNAAADFRVYSPTKRDTPAFLYRR